jgi:hypothetical protein
LSARRRRQVEEGIDRAAHMLLFLSAAGTGAAFASCLDQAAVQARPPLALAPQR